MSIEPCDVTGGERRRCSTCHLHLGLSMFHEDRMTCKSCLHKGQLKRQQTRLLQDAQEAELRRMRAEGEALRGRNAALAVENLKLKDLLWSRSAHRVRRRRGGRRALTVSWPGRWAGQRGCK